MKFSKYVSFLLLPVLLGASSNPPVHDCDGSLPKDASPSVAVNFLKQDRASINEACVVDAIHLLDNALYLPAIPTLIDYLDFKIPAYHLLRHANDPTGGSILQPGHWHIWEIIFLAPFLRISLLTITN